MSPSALRLSFAAVVLIGAGLAPPARAMPRNARFFEELQTELIRRLDEDFTGDLERAQKKQQRAVKKALKAVEKTSKSLASDLSAVRAATQKLAKAFPAEFAGVGGIEDPIGALLDDLGALVLESRRALDARLGVEEAKIEDQIAAAISKADVAITDAAVASDLAARAKSLGSAAKFLASGNKKADRKRFGSFVTAVVDGVEFFGVDNRTQYDDVAGIFDVTATTTGDDGSFRRVTFGLPDVRRRGTYPLEDLAIAMFESGPGGAPPTVYSLVPGTGTVVVRKFDTKRPWILGTFSFDATDGVDTVTVSDGAFGFGVIDDGGPVQGETTVTYAINAAPVTGDVGLTSVGYVPAGMMFTLAAGRDDDLVGPTDTIHVNIGGVAPAGPFPATFPVTSPDVTVTFFRDAGPAVFTSGSLTITTLNVAAASATGTFSFSGTDDNGAIAITNGVFSTTELQIP